MRALPRPTHLVTKIPRFSGHEVFYGDRLSKASRIQTV